MPDCQITWNAVSGCVSKPNELPTKTAFLGIVGVLTIPRNVTLTRGAKNVVSLVRWLGFETSCCLEIFSMTGTEM